jgi:hypothetical protein
MRGMQSVAEAERLFRTIDDECARANGGRGRAWCDDTFPATEQVLCAIMKWDLVAGESEGDRGMGREMGKVRGR